MSYYVGLDVSMKETFFCIMNETGKVMSEGRVKTDPDLIAERLKQHQLPLAKVGIESGSLSHWLVEALISLEIPAICIDARKMAAVLSVEINKTDKNDARGIANAMRTNLYRTVMQKTREAIELGTLLGSRRLIVQQKVQLTNAVRGFLKTYGLKLGPCGDKTFCEKVRKTLLNQPALTQEGIEGLLNCLGKVLEQLNKLTSKVEELARKDVQVRQLMTIPGVGPITACSYKAAIDDPTRFKNSRAVGAYLGMTPKQYSSGETKKQGRISKCGSSEARFLLNEAATVLLTRSKKWSKLKAWGLKICRKHGFKKAAMAVGRKLAVIMHRMLIDGTEFVCGEAKEKIREEKSIRPTGLARAI